MSDPSRPPPPPVRSPAPTPAAPPPRRRRSGCLLTMLLVLLLISLGVNLLLSGDRIAGQSWKVPVLRGRDLTEETIEGDPEATAKIAVIPVSGIIRGALLDGRDSAAWVCRQIQRAMDDDDVVGILLEVDTPGGEVAASDMIYDQLRRAAEKKKVLAWMGSLATSGGYYVSAACDEIMAMPMTSTGSIGVILVLFRYGELMNKIGVQPRIFAAGRYKDLFSGLREEDFSEEEKAIIRSRVQVAYDRFVEIVAEARGLPEETLREDIADGRIFSAEEAREMQLIDAIGYREDAVERLRKLAGAPDARLIRYDRGFSIRNLLHAAGGGSTVRVELGAGCGFALRPGALYYLPLETARAAWIEPE